MNSRITVKKHLNDLTTAEIVQLYHQAGLTIADAMQGLDVGMGEYPETELTGEESGLGYDITFTYGDGVLVVSVDDDRINARMLHVCDRGTQKSFQEA